jgi:thioester reductase-like protein
VLIGRPVANTELLVLDEHREPLPIGAVGELYIGGDGLARGYWRRPDLTAERFVDHPFRPGERVYRTGDLARQLPNGLVLCLGRIDDQVKVHGVRIELGEIEAALRQTPGIRDAAVTVRQDSFGDAQLVAHLIASERSVSPSEVRSHLRKILPEVMVPPHIRFTDAFPMGVGGKIRKGELPGPDQPGASDEAVHAPKTATERTLAKIWAGVLKIDAAFIGRESQFMDLGGHSLLMTPLMVEVRRLFGVSFNLREFFEKPTILAFAALIDERRKQSESDQRAARPLVLGRDDEWGRQRMSMLIREASLPAGLAPARGVVYQSAALEKVFLTGATGFLGAYILKEILETTSAEVHCLVRSRRGEINTDRLERQMRKYDLWRQDEGWLNAWHRRVQVVEGDVTLPRLGLPVEVYEALASEMNAIIHGAAHVNFIYPYEALRATNVLGLHEVIRFAFHRRIKPVHHISTAAIWPMGATRTFYERDPIEHGEALNLGYDEAKWVAERCLLNAESRGLPVTRYRPGEVGGDSRTGHCVTDHFVIATIAGFLQFGAFPRLEMELDIAPIDYVARALTYLVFQRNPLGRAFHLTNPRRHPIGHALLYLRSRGYEFEELPFDALRDRLVNSRDFGSNALFPYQAVLESMDEVSLELPTYDTTETEKELRGSGITCAPADQNLFGLYLDHLVEIGFVPRPDAASAVASGR